MTMTTTTPKTLTVEQVRALAVSDVAMTALTLSIPLDTLRDVEAELAKNPKDGPRYCGGDQRWGWDGGAITGTRPQHAELRFDYCRGKVHTAIAALACDLEMLEWDADAAIAKLTREAESQARAEGRLDRFDMSHNITDFGGMVETAAGWRGNVEDERMRRRQAGNGPGDLRLIYGPPQWQIRTLAVGAIRRWLPAVQNMIGRLPPGERQAAAGDAGAMLRGYLLTLGKLHTLCKKPSDEYRRWEEGFGAVDQAIIQSFGMVAYALDLSKLMQDDGTDLGRMVEPLQRRTRKAFDDAAKALRELAASRFKVLDYFARNHDKADIAAFARANGGIAPSLEVKYHAKGSGFVAY